MNSKLNVENPNHNQYQPPNVVCNGPRCDPKPIRLPDRKRDKRVNKLRRKRINMKKIRRIIHLVIKILTIQMFINHICIVEMGLIMLSLATKTILHHKTNRM